MSWRGLRRFSIDFAAGYAPICFALALPRPSTRPLSHPDICERRPLGTPCDWLQAARDRAREVCFFDASKTKGVEPTAESLEAGAAYERMMLGCSEKQSFAQCPQLMLEAATK